MENEDDELEKLFKKIKNKLDSKPHLKDEIESLVLRLEEIFETKVALNLILEDEEVENYRDELLKYSEPDFEIVGEKTMTVNNLIELLDDEEKDLYLSFDPIYLKEGLNDINDMIITTINKKIILVPVSNKKEE